MDIVHFGKYYWPEKGGVETAVRNLAELGHDLGYSVECVVSTPRRDTNHAASVGPIKVVRYPYRTKILSTPISLHFYHFLKNREAKMDVLHVHLPNPTAELTLLWRLLRKPMDERILIPFVHAFPVNQKLFGRIWFHLITQRILSRARYIFASNSKFVEAFPQIAKWRSKIIIMPFFVDHVSDGELAEIAVARRRMPRRALALGRLVPYKGFDVLLRAWQLALSRYPELSRYELNIVGDGPERAKLERLVAELGLDRLAVVRGPCGDQEKKAYFESAQFFVAPSRNNSETFGISILEAMAYALPVITTDLDTGVRLLSRDGVCGAVVQAGAILPLADAIIRMAKLDDAGRERIGVGNFNFTRATFSREKCATAYRNFFGAIATDRAQPVRDRGSSPEPSPPSSAS